MTADTNQSEETEGAKLGRPFREWTAEETATIIDLARIGATNEDIAAEVHCDVKTLRTHYSQQIELARASGNNWLRRLRHDLAASGNVPIILHLSKHQLGETDKLITENTNQDIRINLVRSKVDSNEDDIVDAQ